MKNEQDSLPKTNPQNNNNVSIAVSNSIQNIFLKNSSEKAPKNNIIKNELDNLSIHIQRYDTKNDNENDDDIHGQEEEEDNYGNLVYLVPQFEIGMIDTGSFNNPSISINTSSY